MDADRQVQVIQSRGLQTASDTENARRTADALVQGAIESLKKPITVPKSSGVDTSRVDEAVGEASDTRDIVSEIIDDETDRFGMAIEGQKTAIRKGGEASAQGVMANQARAQQEADVYNSLKDTFNSDIAGSAQRLRALRPAAEEKLRRVQEMQKVGPLDNPLEWFANQFQLPAAIGDYNRDADVVNYLQNTIDDSIKNRQDEAVFTAKGIPTITTSMAKAEADKLRALAEQNSALADENLAKTNVTFATHKLSNDLSIANTTKEMTGLELQNEQLKYTSMINEINLADKHSERLLKAATLIEKLEGTKGLDIILTNYDRTMGHPLGTTTRYTFEKFAEGQRQNMVAIGAGSLGADPFEGMVNWFRSRPGPAASPETKVFFDYLRDQSEVVSTSREVQAMDEKQKPAAISKRLKDQIGIDLAGASKSTSIFFEMSPTKMLLSGAIPPDSHLAKTLVPFTKQTGPVDTSIIIEAINQEYPNPGEAGAVISDYYKRNIQLRNSVMNTSLAGITLPTNYVISNNPSLLTGGLSGQRMKIDLTDPVQATKLILLKRASQLVGKGMTDELTGTGQTPGDESPTPAP